MLYLYKSTATAFLNYPAIATQSPLLAANISAGLYDTLRTGMRNDYWRILFYAKSKNTFMKVPTDIFLLMILLEMIRTSADNECVMKAAGK